MLIPREKTYLRVAQVYIACLAIIVVSTFRQYGITWDEELQSQYGIAIVDYYASFFKDQRYLEIFNLYLYGGMFDGLASLIDSLTPFSVYETRHLINAIFGLIGLWGTWRVARFFGGGLAGLLALVLLSLTPMYYGHMFNNPKDIPFAAGIIWSIYYMARVLSRLPRPNRGLLIKLGIVYGLTLGIRVGGAMLFAFWLVPIGLDALTPLWSLRNGNGVRGSAYLSLKHAFYIVIPVGLVAYGVMLICWPWAQQAPIINPLRALSEFSNFPQDVEVLLAGTTYRSTQLPWYYVPLYFAVQLPVLFLLLFSTSILTFPNLVKHIPAHRRSGIVVLVLMLVVPILYAMVRHPALYDAVRHFLFAAVLGSVLASLAAVNVYRWAVSKFVRVWSRQLISVSFVAILAITALSQIVVMIRLHPYEYIYANSMNGGVQGIVGRYELDYWGSSFKEAAEKLQDYVASEGGVPPGKIYKIAICGPWDAAMIYLPPDYEPVVANEPAEFFLSTTRWQCQNMRQGREIIRIKRLGAPLSIIKDLRGGYELMPK